MWKTGIVTMHSKKKLLNECRSGRIVFLLLATVLIFFGMRVCVRSIISAGRLANIWAVTTPEERREASYGDCTRLGYGYIREALKKIPADAGFPQVKYRYWAHSASLLFGYPAASVNDNFLIGINMEETDLKSQPLAVSRQIDRHTWLFRTVHDVDTLDRLDLVLDSAPEAACGTMRLLHSKFRPEEVLFETAIHVENSSGQIVKVVPESRLREFSINRGTVDFIVEIEGNISGRIEQIVAVGTRVDIRNYEVLHSREGCFLARKLPNGNNKTSRPESASLSKLRIWPSRSNAVEAANALITLFLLFILPVLAGHVAVPREKPALQWWLGFFVIGTLLAVRHIFELPYVVVYASLATLPGLAIWRRGFLLSMRQRITRPALLAMAFSIVFLTASIVRVLMSVLRSDALEIWYNKALHIARAENFSATPFVNYPNFGSAWWAFFLRLVGLANENVGRILFPVLYGIGFAIFFQLLPKESKGKWTVALVWSSLLFLFSSIFHFGSGYQDGLIMLSTGVVALLFARLLKRELPDGQATPTCSHERFLPFILAGLMVYIKNEAIILAGIIVVSFVVIYALRHRPYSLKQYLLPSGVFFLLSCSRPLLLLMHGISPARVQGSAFTLQSLVDLPQRFERSSAILAAFWQHWQIWSYILLFLLFCAAAVIWLRQCHTLMWQLSFLLSALLLHHVFVFTVFLATEADLMWHLDTAASRLLYQHHGLYALTILLIFISFTEKLCAQQPEPREGARSSAEENGDAGAMV